MAFNLFGPPTKDDIRVGYIDPVLGLVEGVTLCQANDYAKTNPGTTFIFRNGNNVIQYLNINEVNQIDPNILTSTDECGGINQRRECGPPVIQFFGGGGIGAAGNPVIGRDGSLLAVDIVRGGNGYQYAPLVAARDNCNYGSGATFTAIIGEVTETIETYENEADFEDYEICEPTDVGYGRLYGPNGEDLGPWEPRLYTDPGEDPIRKEIEDYQTLVRKLARNPFWSTRSSKPIIITSSDPKLIPSKNDVTVPAWNEFMNKYAISPTSPSNIIGSDYSGVGFTFNWVEEFPDDGEYVFRGLVDNNAQFADLYFDDELIGTIPRYDDAIRPIQRTITKGAHNIRVELYNPPDIPTVNILNQLNQPEQKEEYVKVAEIFKPARGVASTNDGKTLFTAEGSLLAAADRGFSFVNPDYTFHNDVLGTWYQGKKVRLGKWENTDVNTNYFQLDENTRLTLGTYYPSGDDPSTRPSLVAGKYYLPPIAPKYGIAIWVKKSTTSTTAVETVSSVTSSATETASSRSWNQNPMGLALTIDAPNPPPPPQEQPPVQQGRCPNNPIWTTRFPGAAEQWYPVRYLGEETERTLSWSKFLNRYAISPVPPLDTPTSDNGGVVFTNSWDIDIPYDGFYKFITEYDDDGKVYLDGDLAFTFQTAQRDIWKGLSDRVRSQKVFITKGRHKIGIELENKRTETTARVNQKIFRTLDWLTQEPAKSKPKQRIICQAGGGFGGISNGVQNNVGTVKVGLGENGSPGLAPGNANKTTATGGGAGLRSGKSVASGATLDGAESSISSTTLPSGPFTGNPTRAWIYSSFGSFLGQNYVPFNGNARYDVKTGYGYGGSIHFSANRDGGSLNELYIYPERSVGGSGAVRISFNGKKQEYTTPGTYEFIVPEGVTYIDVICIGGGGSGFNNSNYTRDTLKNSGGSGGAFAYNASDVTPGTKLKIVVGSGGSVTVDGSKNGEDSYVEILESLPNNSQVEIDKIVGGTVKDGVTYQGPPIIHYQDNRWGSYMNKNSLSPLIPGEPPDSNGTKRFTWKDVTFPETGQYEVTFLADNNARLFVDGIEVLRAQGFAENPQAFKVNVTQGIYDLVIESEYPYNSIETNTQQYFSVENPTGFALEIRKNVSVIQPGSGQSWKENPMGIGAILIPPPCPRRIRGRGVVTDVLVNDPGNGYLRPIPQNQGYPVALRLKEVIVENPGINYNCGVDILTITPNNGAELDYVCDPFGKIREVKVLNPGLGFTEYPEIRMISPEGVTPTGVNASFRPVFEVVRDPIVLPERLIQVTDLVGLKQTGYVDGRPYYGAVYYDQGVRFAGFYETIGEPVRVYDTLQESITGEVTTPASAIERSGTDISSNDPRLNIPGTPENLI